MKTANQKNSDPRLVETRKFMFGNFTLMPTDPRTVHELITPCPLNTVKLLPNTSRVGHTAFRALACCGHLCLAKK